MGVNVFSMFEKGVGKEVIKGSVFAELGRGSRETKLISLLTPIPSYQDLN